MRIHERLRSWFQNFLDQNADGCIYKTSNQKEAEFLKILSWLVDFHNTTYENIIIIGDFNMTIENHYFNDFREMFVLRAL